MMEIKGNTLFSLKQNLKIGQIYDNIIYTKETNNLKKELLSIYGALMKNIYYIDNEEMLNVVISKDMIDMIIPDKLIKAISNPSIIVTSKDNYLAISYLDIIQIQNKKIKQIKFQNIYKDIKTVYKLNLKEMWTYINKGIFDLKNRRPIWESER